jgi:hypothetical protein
MIAETADIAIHSRTPKARSRYIETTEQVSRDLASDTEARELLEKSVAWLELFFISALVWDFINQERIESLPDLKARARNMGEHIRASFPDFELAEQGIRAVLDDLRPAEPSIWPSHDWPQIIRSFDAILAEFPMDSLNNLCKQVDEPALGHRARNAYDALRAFVRRNDPGCAEVMRIVGDQYRRGHIGLRDAARLLGMSSSDAVFELESGGFGRAAEAIRLSDDARTAIYSRLRERRLQYQGPSAIDNDLVERDAIASERIESVDARSWIRRR